MTKIIDLTGRQFGRLKVLRFDRCVHRKSYWVCQCACGTVKSFRSDCLKDGNSNSCGCLSRERHPVVHGQAKTKLYHVYYGMKQRCYNPNHESFARYGGRGISICEEWLNDYQTFAEWSKNNGYRDGLSIDRINNDGNYEPSNCRWTTGDVQRCNTSHNTWIEHDGETMILRDWCRRFGVNTATACYRRKQGKSFEEVFKPTTKV